MKIIIAVFIAIIIATLGRIIPHVPNATPLASLAILSAIMFHKRWAVVLTLLSLTISDVILDHFTQMPIWGQWTWFTYSGYVAMAMCVPHNHRIASILLYTLYSTFGYWVWTNLGTWISGLDYPRNWEGLGYCYFAGLPFLRNAILGNLIYMVMFWFALQKWVIVQHKKYV